jgi:Zn-dependent protease
MEDHYYAKPKPSLKSQISKYFGPIIAFGFLILKFIPVILKTGGTMLLTIWVYSMFYGWKFAIGFVLLILIHELGHMIMAKVFKLNVGWPVFIPFMGALIALKEAPKNAWVEFWIAAGGPITGSIAAVACHYIFYVTGNPLFAALAYTGYFLNLFNLMPTGFLDGGRMVTALSPWLWVVGIVIAGAFAVINPSFIIFLIIIFSLPRLFSLFKKKSEEEKRFYEVNAMQRLIAAIIYFGLILFLSVGMLSTHHSPSA